MKTEHKTTITYAESRWRRNLSIILVLSLLALANQKDYPDKAHETLYQSAYSAYQYAYNNLIRPEWLCDSEYVFPQEEDIFMRHEGLKEAYENSFAYWISYYDLESDEDRVIREGIKNAIYREVFEGGDLFFCSLDGYQVSDFKSIVGDFIQPEDGNSSLGIMDQRPYRFTASQYDLLPEDVKKEVLFNNELGHVDPASFKEYINNGDSFAKLDKAILFATVMGASRKHDMLENFSTQALPYNEQVQIVSDTVCCSGASDYGSKLLIDPFARKQYFDSCNLNDHDHRGRMLNCDSPTK